MKLQVCIAIYAEVKAKLRQPNKNMNSLKDSWCRSHMLLFKYEFLFHLFFAIANVIYPPPRYKKAVCA